MRKQIKKKAIVTPDPTIPDVSVEVDGETFHLCFDFSALALAKAELRKQGVEVNILRSIDFREIDVDTLPALFFAAALRYRPDLEWSRAVELVNLRTAAGIHGALASAYMAAMLEPGKNPPEAPAES